MWMQYLSQHPSQHPLLIIPRSGVLKILRCMFLYLSYLSLVIVSPFPSLSFFSLCKEVITTESRETELNLNSSPVTPNCLQETMYVSNSSSGWNYVRFQLILRLSFNNPAVAVMGFLLIRDCQSVPIYVLYCRQNLFGEKDWLNTWLLVSRIWVRVFRSEGLNMLIHYK